MACVTDETMAAWADNVLDDTARGAVEDHAATCAPCRSLIAALAGVALRDAAAIGERGDLGAEGATIGRYRVTGSLGHGGMGVVLRGHDPLLDREVAIKMVRSAESDAATRAQLVREAQTLARIDHPNVVRVHDAGMIDDDVFVAMAFVDGPTLAAWLGAAPREPAACVRALATAGRGLAAIHALGIVHRDVKPDNIIIAGDRGVVVDLGLARPAGHGARPVRAAGTPKYVAPELAAGKPATPASDQHAWWRVVREATAGCALPPRRRAALDRAIARGLADDPGARFASMTDAIDALDRAALGRRRRWPVLAAAAIALVGGTAAALAATGALSHDDAATACTAIGAGDVAGWTAARPAIAARLAASGADAPRVLAALDQRAARYTELRGQACRTGALREQICLDDTWRDHARAFGELTASEPAAVRDAVDRLIFVLPVDRCADASLPALPAAPPPARAFEVAALDAALDAQKRSAVYSPERRVARVRALEPAVIAADYPPLVAKWHLRLAGELVAAGDVGAADEAELAIRLADAAGDDRLRARALLDRLRVAFTTGDRDTAELERAAEAAAARLGNPGITAELRASEGLARLSRSDLPGSLAALRDADRMFAAIAIDAHAPQVQVAQNLANLQQITGDLDGAAATLDRGLELGRRRFPADDPRLLELRGVRAVGLIAGKPEVARAELAAVAAALARAMGDAPPTAQALAFLCSVDLKLEAAAPAARDCRDALAVATRVYGDHPQLVSALLTAGGERLDADAPAEALPLFEHALALTEHNTVSPLQRPLAQGDVALALDRLHRDPARARALARAALPALREMPDTDAIVAGLEGIH